MAYWVPVRLDPSHAPCAVIVREAPMVTKRYNIKARKGFLFPIIFQETKKPSLVTPFVPVLATFH